MDAEEIYLPPGISSSSAVDLTGTSTGLAISVPPSPSENQTAFARRRTSWGRLDAEPPLRHHSPVVTEPDGTASDTRHNTYTLSDDPAFLIHGSNTNSGLSYGSMSNRYEIEHDINTYSTEQAGPSTTSLIRNVPDEATEDDRAYLTRNMARISTNGGWNQYTDEEGNARSSSRSPRKSVQYDPPPSPLKMAGSAFKKVSQRLSHMSSRVGAGPERLLDGDDVLSVGKSTGDEEDDLIGNRPIRGHTLGFFGPNSSVRFALFRCLMHPWVFLSIFPPFMLMLFQQLDSACYHCTYNCQCRCFDDSSIPHVNFTNRC